VNARQDVEWVVVDALARGRRPGYFLGRSVSKAEVDAWIGNVKALGVKSIICLLAEDQLPHYDKLETGLISYYRAAGFDVVHVPARDHQIPPAVTRSAHGNLERVSASTQAGSDSLQCRHRSNGEGGRAPSAATTRRRPLTLGVAMRRRRIDCWDDLKRLTAGAGERDRVRWHRR
jgi:hypothetical protein